MSDNFANNSNMTDLMTAIGNKIKAAGHTIYNAAGTALTRRSKLKFTGRMKVTDDSTNGQTVVDDSPDHIEWDDWCAMSAQEQAAVKEAVIDNAPGVDGGLTANLLTKLWENPDPSQTFAAQDITLSSSDYDFLLILYNTTNTSMTGIGHSVVVKKGSSISLDCVMPYGGMPAANYYRLMTRNSNTSYSVAACRIGGVSNSGSVSYNDQNTSSLIPVVIYGIKQTINLKFSAIASDISTAADHCMLSDGVRNIEDYVNSLAGTKTIANLNVGDILTIGTDSENTRACIAFTNWVDNVNFPAIYGSGWIMRSLDASYDMIIYITTSGNYYYGIRRVHSGGTNTITWKKANNDDYITVTTSLGSCSYNDKWIIYKVTGDVVVNMSAWSSLQVDTLPVSPKFETVSEGFATNYNGTFASGFFTIKTDGTVYYSTRDAALINNTTPLQKYFLMPR